jgi:hypothetical protein
VNIGFARQVLEGLLETLVQTLIVVIAGSCAGGLVPVPAVYTGGAFPVQNVPPSTGAGLQGPARAAVKPKRNGVRWKVLAEGRSGTPSELPASLSKNINLACCEGHILTEGTSKASF